jgi:hypothetical protein
VLLLRPGRVLRFGRNRANDICTPHPRISRFHLEVLHEGASVWVLCPGRNGFWLNGERRPDSSRFPLGPGDAVDLFGFRLTLAAAPEVDPDWLVWNGGTVPRLAATIDAESALDRLPLLADALEDAGCSDLDLLGPLRSPHHGRWPLDLVLGRG